VPRRQLYIAILEVGEPVFTLTVQQSLWILSQYRRVAQSADRSARSSDALRFGVQTGEISLTQLLTLPQHHRIAIDEHAPLIDIFLGSTRVYKRTSKTLFFAFCPDIGRFIEPVNKGFAVQLPNAFSNALVVKLAVSYMVQFLLDVPVRVRYAGWRVRVDVTGYIYLTKLFAFIAMPSIARELEVAILGRFQERPLSIEQIRFIWGGENMVTGVKSGVVPKQIV
jgi:hypothetical protein